MEQVKANELTETFIFETTGQVPIKSVQKYYSSTDMIGRHYSLESDKLPGVIRYYTICNCLRPEVNAEYTRVLEQAVVYNRICHFD